MTRLAAFLAKGDNAWRLCLAFLVPLLILAIALVIETHPAFRLV